jgi:signal transduction histidine kinase
VLGTAATLSLVLFVLTELNVGSADTLTFLYVVPVALIALELGLRAGLGAALAALALIGVWSLTRSSDIGTAGLLTRAGVLLAIGALCGRFADRMRAGRARQQQLLDSSLALAELSDPGVLPLVIAREALELSPARGVRVTIEAAEPVQLGELGGEPLQLRLGAGAARVGLIEIAPPPGREFTGDERLGLELLAMQAAVAAERQHMLALRRRQDALHEELSATQGRLAEQGERLVLVLDHQEDERRQLARELQEEAAQALAAIQLGLAALERDLGSEPTRTQVEALRSSLAETLQALRELAAGLRPPTLDMLGLEPALESLAARARERSGHRIEVELGGARERLPVALETAVYRLVDDIVGSLAPAWNVHVSLDRSSNEVRLVATMIDGGDGMTLPPELVARLRARLELAAGALSVYENGVHTLSARIPLAPAINHPDLTALHPRN